MTLIPEWFLPSILLKVLKEEMRKRTNVCAGRKNFQFQIKRYLPDFGQSFPVIPGLVIPSFIKIFIDKYLVNGYSGFVMPLLLVMGAVLLVNSALVYIQQYYLLKLETKLALTTSSKFLWHVFHLPIAFLPNVTVVK
jgi:ABC-type bacteriocin/lantibiotic exporter with double-glycine peptidase domain